jgi:HD superfamily phosphohydrolase
MDIRTILAGYRTTLQSGAHDAPSLLALLRCYNLPWFAQSCFSDEATSIPEVKRAGFHRPDTKPVLCYQSLLRGDEQNPILKRVRRLAARPQFYRLNWIRQLSTTSLAINLDGNHNRLSHSLGTLDIASRFVAALQSDLTDIEKKAILVYAFIHDCFHGPMGHTLDLIKDVIWGARVEERIDKHLLLVNVEEGLKESGFLWETILSDVADGDRAECKAIFVHLEAFLNSESRQRTFMKEIVDSDLDSDRIDYVWRDHVHLMMVPFEAQRGIEDLIGGVRALADRDGDKHLYFDVQHAAIAEDVLERRVKCYIHFYEHPLKVVSDEMLTHAIYYALDEENLLTSEGELGPKGRDFAEQFSYLTDDGLFNFLTELTAKPNHFISYSLFHDFRANRPFQIVEKRGLKRDSFPSLSRRFVALNHSLEGILREEADSIRRYVRQHPIGLKARSEYIQVLQRFNEEAVKDIALTDADPWVLANPNWKGSILKYSVEDDLYRIQFLYGASFRKKLLLEKMLWQELFNSSEAPRFKDALASLALHMAGGEEKDSQRVKGLLQKLEQTPLVFINLSWLPGITDQELLNHKRGFSPTTIRFHSGGRPIDVQPELEVKPSEEDYNVTLCAPPVLLKTGVEDLIRRTFNAFLKSRRWLIPDVLDRFR